jgi:uncharacterized protein YacL
MSLPPRASRSFEFRTSAILYVILGLIIGLLIHFVVLSSPTLNWLAAK